MFRIQVIGPVFAVLAVPAMIVGLYVFNLRSDLAAADRVIAIERAGREDWHRKYDDLQRAVSANAACVGSVKTTPEVAPAPK